MVKTPLTVKVTNLRAASRRVLTNLKKVLNLIQEGESVADKLIKYIKANPKANSSEITAYLDEIIGIPKWNQEKDCFE